MLIKSFGAGTVFGARFSRSNPSTRSMIDSLFSRGVPECECGQFKLHSSPQDEWTELAAAEARVRRLLPSANHTRPKSSHLRMPSTDCLVRSRALEAKGLLANAPRKGITQPHEQTGSPFPSTSRA